jgi:hypothetical protein
MHFAAGKGGGAREERVEEKARGKRRKRVEQRYVKLR